MKRADSAFVSTIATRILIGIVTLSFFLMPFILSEYNDMQMKILKADSILVPLLIFGYSVAITGLMILLLLGKLLGNIRNNSVFIRQNVKILRVLSYLCFIEAMFFSAFGFYKLLSIMVAIAAIFLGMIMRVLKNTLDIAVEIKEENEYTI